MFYRNLTRVEKFLLILVFLFAFALRLPGIRFDIEPFPYCDEDMFLQPAFEMIRGSGWIPPHFKSGGINFLIPRILGGIYNVIASEPITLEALRMMSRIFASVILASLAVFPVFSAIQLHTRSFRTAFVGSALYAASPLSTAGSTWFYPDGYVAFFSALVIYLSDLAHIRNDGHSKKSPILIYSTLGVVLGTAISTKYNAIILFGYPLLSSIFFQRQKFVIVSFFRLTMKNKYFLLTFGALVLTFFALNFGVFEKSDQFFKDLKIGHYTLSSDYLHGWLYYAYIYFFFTIGLMPIFALLAASFDFSSFISLAMKFLAVPVIYLFIIGRYNLLFSRNIQIIVPFLVIFVAICIDIIFRMASGFFEKRVLTTVFSIVLVFFLSRPFNQLRQDLLEDSRLLARKMAKTAGWAAIYSNEGCGQSRIVNRVSLDPDYVILDSWFGGVDEIGNPRSQKQETFGTVFSVRHLRDLHYVNHVGCWNWGLPFDFSELPQRYELSTIISGGGPVVSVFRKKGFPQTNE